MNLLKWFRKKEEKFVSVPVLPRLSLAEWQENNEAVGQFRELYRDERFQKMLAILQTSRPRQRTAQYSAEHHIGFIEGYEAALTQIYLMTMPKQQSPEQPEADYNSDQILKQWSK